MQQTKPPRVPKNLSEDKSLISANWKALKPLVDKEQQQVAETGTVSRTVSAKRRQYKKRRDAKKRKLNETLQSPAETGFVNKNNKTEETGSEQVVSRKKRKQQLDKLTNGCDASADQSELNGVASTSNGSSVDNKAPKKPELTKCIALDCEFVGVGEKGKGDMVARVSMVNLRGECVYDKFVKPTEPVVDYRTEVSGIRPENLEDGAEDFKVVQKEVAKILNNRVLVGHAVHKDLKVLFLSHPRHKTRDTSKYRPLQAVANTYRPALKKLTSTVLGLTIQTGEHDSVIDARVTMELYRQHRKEWERSGRHLTKMKTKTQHQRKFS